MSWNVKQENRVVKVISDNNILICETDINITHTFDGKYYYPTGEKIVQNAHLISAAPELLEFVEMMLCDFNGLYYQNRLSDNGLKTYQQIKDVLKKAKGE